MLSLAMLSLVCSSARAGSDGTAGLVVDGMNVIGGELALIALVLDPLLEAQIQDSPQRTLFQILELDDPLAQNDDFVEVALLGGNDLNGDPSDDFSGNAEFEVDPTSLDLEGNPIVVFTPGSITAGELVAGPADLLFGGLPLQDVVLGGQLQPSASSFVSNGFEGAVPATLLEGIDAPFPFGTVLDMLVFLGATEDVDLDGDGVNDAFSIIIAITAISCEISYPPVGQSFIRGDCNSDGNVELSDAIVLLTDLFQSGTIPPCPDAYDSNDDGAFDVADAIYLLNYLFLAGAPIPAPSSICGLDGTTDVLTCGAFSACP